MKAAEARLLASSGLVGIPVPAGPMLFSWRVFWVADFRVG